MRRAPASATPRISVSSPRIIRARSPKTRGPARGPCAARRPRPQHAPPRRRAARRAMAHKEASRQPCRLPTMPDAIIGRAGFASSQPPARLEVAGHPPPPPPIRLPRDLLDNLAVRKMIAAKARRSQVDGDQRGDMRADWHARERVDEAARFRGERPRSGSPDPRPSPPPPLLPSPPPPPPHRQSDATPPIRRRRRRKGWGGCTEDEPPSVRSRRR